MLGEILKVCIEISIRMKPAVVGIKVLVVDFQEVD
jgi:hypothetical protein